jgi:predicted AAA+ superfamily ATPase
LRKGVADLSRRFPKISVPLLSLRDYIYLSENIELPILDPFGDLSEAEEIVSRVNIQAAFRQYLAEGFRPIFLEGDYQQRILNIIEKTIFSDVPFFVSTMQDNYLRIMNAVIGHLALAAVPTVNVESLCSDWSVGKEKLYELLYALEHVGLLNIVRYRTDHKTAGKGAKLLLSDPSMYAALGGNLGHVREAYLVTLCKNAGLSVHANKDERKGDFVIEGKTVEVGGKNKKSKKADFVVRDDIEIPHGNALPLWSFGFLY